jgi:hypothetical protein
MLRMGTAHVVPKVPNRDKLTKQDVLDSVLVKYFRIWPNLSVFGQIDVSTSGATGGYSLLSRVLRCKEVDKSNMRPFIFANLHYLTT